MLYKGMYVFGRQARSVNHSTRVNASRYRFSANRRNNSNELKSFCRLNKQQEQAVKAKEKLSKQSLLPSQQVSPASNT